jgi:hypothetical protein
MIDLSTLKPDHVGQLVIYTPGSGPREDGVITSWNDKYIFVRYGADKISKATNPKYLDFLPSFQ